MNTVFEIRSALQWSQSKLADEIGVSFATVNRWENEKSTPNRLAQEKMLAIAKKIISRWLKLYTMLLSEMLQKSLLCIRIKWFYTMAPNQAFRGKSNQPAVTAVTSELDFIWERIRSSRLR